MAGTDYSSWATQSSPYDDAIAQAEQANGLPPGFLRKQLILESGLNPAAQSNAPNSHATGIAQEQPAFAKQFGGINPKNPIDAINAAATADAQYYKQFGSWGKALLAYHDGPEAVENGKISPEAQAYWQNFQQVPDYKGAPPQSADPFASVDQAHAAAAAPTQGTNPFDAVDQAFGQKTASTTTHAPMTPQQVAQADIANSRANYDAEDFPTRAAISAGEGMTNLVRGAQGVGADIVQGIGELTGSNALTSAAQNERNKLAAEQSAEAPMQAGTHGLSNFVGQAAPYVASAPLGGAEAGGLRLLARLGTSAVRNALVGGATQAVGNTPTTAQGTAPSLGQDVTQRAEQGGIGALTGGILGPAAEVVGTGVGAAARGVMNKLTDLFGGAERTAASHVASVNPNGQGAPDFSAADKIPGYTPSAAEATGDPRLAWLDRQLRQRFDDYRATADAQDQANNQAVSNVITSIRGDRDSLAKLYADRQQQTAPLYQQAAQEASAAGARVDTTPVWTTIMNTLKAKQGETSVTNALNQYLKPGSLIDAMPDGSYRLTSDVNRLANIRNQMSTDIGKQFSTDSAGNDMKAAARPLMAIRDVIDQQLAQANPSLAAARQKFAELSEPINQQEALQELLPPEKDGTQFTAPKISSVLQKIRDAQASSGANAAKAVTPDQLQQLQDVHDVLANRSNIRNSQPGQDIKDRTKEIVQSVADTGSWNPLLYAQHAGSAGGALAGGAAGFLGLSHLHPALGSLLTGAGAVTGGTLGRAAARALERSPSETRASLANMLLDPRSYPVPNVAPSAYQRSVGGQQLSTGVARGTTNALTSGQNNGRASESSP